MAGFALDGLAVLAQTVQVHGMGFDDEAVFFCNSILAFFDLGIEKLLDLATFDAYQMVVMTALVQLEHGFAGFEVMTDQQAGLFELSQHAVDSCKANVEVFGNEQTVDVFSRHVALFRGFEQIENFQTGGSGFEADVLKIAGFAHWLIER